MARYFRSSARLLPTAFRSLDFPPLPPESDVLQYEVANVHYSSANATITPTWFRALQSDGTTVVMDGTVGASGCNLNLTGLSGGQIISGGNVSVSTFTHDVLNASSGL